MALNMIKVIQSLQRLTLNAKCNLNVISSKQCAINGAIYGNSVRNSTNFFNKLPAEALWKGITSVSNAGKKRGRGKRVSRRNIKDLNRGQIIGVGKANILWPGLTAPIIRGRELVEQQQLPEDPDREKKLIEIRNKMGNLRPPKLSPLDRGWSGNKMPGRSIGPPDPIGEESFEGFDTKVLELKTVFNMTGNLGRKRRLSVFAITGNGKGLAGFALGKAVESAAALRKVKNRAGQKLMHINIFRDHTVYHDFFTQFGATKIFVSQRPEGYGLVCHRAIRTVCEVVGIKDLYAKVEGSTNVQHIVKAFMLGLLKQRTHEQIAEEKKLHLVELSKDNEYFPTVLASPVECRKTEDLKHDEVLDFTQYCLDGRVILQRKKFPPFYTKYKSWEIYLKKQEKIRNHDKIRIQLKAEYGELRTFLTDKYPECRPPQKGSFKKDSEENA
ncbi:hypothetical protein PPYR_00363 [Photinus pyralis]|uniref:Small ribosomal subunit protein uS5m n=3 Tax=Photinus pyralis TaxID=7054 RepID=A0A5N4B1G1_PHOPY|nr:hypothetical protein PPYR_00363 [Photinus pyralis]